MNTTNRIVFLYPSDTLNASHIDEQYKEESDMMRQNGFAVTIISLENIEAGLTYIASKTLNGYIVIYRGWMLSADLYIKLIKTLHKYKLIPLITIDNYLQTHYLPNWYPLISDLTPETLTLSLNENIPLQLTKLGWGKYFIKDYVKSLKTSIGSLINSPEDVIKVISEMKKYRGFIEGGICIRKYEDFLSNTETRYFVINKIPYAASADAQIPNIVYECIKRVESPFYSIDVIMREDKQLRIVEIGDGQVSDLVGWNVKRFVEIWTLATNLKSL